MIVKYSKKFTTGPWLNEDIGFETSTEFNDEETILRELRRLKSIAEKFHKDNNPQIVGDKPDFYGHRFDGNMIPSGESNFPPTPIQSVDYKAKERLEKLIDDATTMEELESYRQQAVEHKLLMQYSERFNQLNK